VVKEGSFRGEGTIDCTSRGAEVTAKIRPLTPFLEHDDDDDDDDNDKDKKFIQLVIIYIIHAARPTQHKISYLINMTNTNKITAIVLAMTVMLLRVHCI
jgi:hypothetical protein